LKNSILTIITVALLGTSLSASSIDFNGMFKNMTDSVTSISTSFSKDASGSVNTVSKDSTVVAVASVNASKETVSTVSNDSTLVATKMSTTTTIHNALTSKMITDVAKESNESLKAAERTVATLSEDLYK